MFSGFREFIMRGNVVDLAVAVVIGTAFGAVITSFVTDILTPLLGVCGLPNFAELSFSVGRATVNYGLFLNQVISFVIVAFAIFLIIKQVNRFRRSTEPAAPTDKTCPRCIMTVPLGATRCPHCTSELGAAATS